MGPSQSWYRSFVLRLGLTFRTVTSDRGTIPLNWEHLKERFLQRFVWLVDSFKVLKEFVFNIDETGLSFIPKYKRTWVPVDEKTVHVIGDSDKRKIGRAHV